jgi:hypothetical protein
MAKRKYSEVEMIGCLAAASGSTDSTGLWPTSSPPA